MCVACVYCSTLVMIYFLQKSVCVVLKWLLIMWIWGREGQSFYGVETQKKEASSKRASIWLMPFSLPFSLPFSPSFSSLPHRAPPLFFFSFKRGPVFPCLSRLFVSINPNKSHASGVSSRACPGWRWEKGEKQKGEKQGRDLSFLCFPPFRHLVPRVFLKIAACHPFLLQTIEANWLDITSAQELSKSTHSIVFSGVKMTTMQFQKVSPSFSSLSLSPSLFLLFPSFLFFLSIILHPFNKQHPRSGSVNMQWNNTSKYAPQSHPPLSLRILHVFLVFTFFVYLHRTFFGG